MLVDLLSTDCQVSYNCNLAQVIGLHASIYVTELINISRKAMQKKKLFDDKYFVVDRTYITSRTTFDIPEQTAIEKSLSGLNIISFGPIKDSLYIDLDTLSGLMIGDSDIQEKAKKAAQNLATKSKSLTAKQRCAIEMKKHIYTTNSELYSAYSEWIDAVCDKVGWMSQKAVTVGQQTVDGYAKGDLDVALKLIELATTGGFRDMTWAINAFEKDYKSKFELDKKEANKPALRIRKELSSEVF